MEQRSIEEPDAFDNAVSIFSIRCQLKNIYTQTKVDEYSGTGKGKILIADLTRLRLSPELNFSDAFLMHADFDNEVIAGNYLKTGEFDSFWRYSEYNDLFHLSGEPYYSDRLYYRTNIHTAYAKLVTGNLTATAGRQYIRFGSGRLWNPLDVFNSAEPAGIEGAEEQKGTDGLRLEYYPTDKTEMDLIIDGKRVNDSVSPADLSVENCSIIGRLRTSLAEMEISALGGRLTQHTIAGIDVSDIVFDGTLRGGILYRRPDESGSFFQASAGYEYIFAIGIYFLLEYFYNQNSLNENKELYDAFLEKQINGMNEDIYEKLSNQILTYNQHYSGTALGYDITALLRGELFIVYDFQGRGIFINPSLKYNAFQNIDVMTGIMTGHVFDRTSKTSDFKTFAENGLFFASITWFF